MLPSPFAAVLALALLAGLPASAEPPSLPSCEAGVRYIELKADAMRNAPEVCIRPGLATTLFFDSALARVDLEGREGFRRISTGQDMLTLQPSEALPDGKRLLLTVHFKDGAAPTLAQFVLVVHPSEVERQVEISRRPRTMESYQQEVQQARAEARQCQGEKAQLQSVCGERIGLAGLIVHGLMDDKGVSSRVLRKEVVLRPGGTLTPRDVYSYRSTIRRMAGTKDVLRLAVELWLTNEGPTPWKAGSAALVGAQGEVLKVVQVGQPEPIEPGKSRLVVVELEATESEIRGPFTLKLWPAEGGAPSLTLERVRFPQEEGPAKFQWR